MHMYAAYNHHHYHYIFSFITGLIFFLLPLQMLSWAYAVLNAHAERKSILEVEYIGEEGTGLGPSLEFYALTAAEIQQRTLGMWLCDDDYPDDEAREVSHMTVT